MSRVGEASGGVAARVQQARAQEVRPPPPPPAPGVRNTSDTFERAPAAHRGSPALGTPTPVATPTPVGTTGTPVAATDTVATYQSGPPQRPNIQHDNGFLQNPNDPNDPNPIPTESPGLADYAALAEWEVKQRGARALQGVPGVPHNNIPDGLDAYDHFLHGGGEDSHFSYERFVATDPSGQAVLTNSTRDTQQGAEAYYNQLVANDPSLAGKPVTFQITGSQIGVGSSEQFPYPETENWQKAIGGHSTWNSATVTVYPPEQPGGKPRFEMDMTLHAEDRYNFNPGQADIATGAPDADNGRFERTGLGHQYTNYSQLQRHVTWTQGSPENAVSRPMGGR
ncbi:hypothetical protein OV207_24315 [Corallococcus sp. BB11-1]|uniref:hypothetical protein n=1 Tax=Corallococcus sp. BB11-1 TaxID=2996783 RepID=UPI002270A069|nr:hypothetical protein [Corallococcus sp. BB11-1]MCY1034599.1 hypothetical protein [Corallococcus sp. BB11-1]